jgi:hypothetical protein
VDLDRVVCAVEDDDNTGICIACGAETYGVEPDAEKYKCEACDALAVFGAEQLLIYMA